METVVAPGYSSARVCPEKVICFPKPNCCVHFKFLISVVLQALRTGRALPRLGLPWSQLTNDAFSFALFPAEGKSPSPGCGVG